MLQAKLQTPTASLKTSGDTFAGDKWQPYTTKTNTALQLYLREAITATFTQVPYRTQICDFWDGRRKHRTSSPPPPLNPNVVRASTPDAGVQWTYEVGSPFPSVWFGGNVTGSDVPNLQRNHVLNYSSAYFGWQLMNAVPAPVGGCHHEETL